VDVTYTFTVTLAGQQVCASEVGPYVATDSTAYVRQNEINLYTSDFDAILSEIYYCEHLDDIGANSGLVRGFRATFTNQATGSTDVYEYGTLVATHSDVSVECFTTSISTIVTHYKVRIDSYGIGGFIFKDASNTVYVACTGDC
jgi:hypothetical protein